MSNKQQEIVFPRLAPHQRAVFQEVRKSKGTGRVFVVKAMRQVGKSALGQIILMYFALTWSRTKSILIEPTNSQCREQYRGILALLEGSKNVIKAANATYNEIEFVNGSRIICRSAESRENLRGLTCSGIMICDEAAYLSEDIWGIVLPFTNVHNAPVILISSPLFRSGYFYDEFTSPLNTSFDWSVYDMKKFLSPEKKEEYRQKWPVAKFRSEVLGEWLEENSAVFGDFSKVLNNHPDIEPRPYYMGVDWGQGTGNDSTAISILNSHNEQIFLRQFNNLDATATVAEIQNITDMFHPDKIVVEINSIGRIFYDLLKEKLRGYTIIPFNTTNDSKQRIISALQLAIQNSTITLLDDPMLKLQFANYEIKKTPTGKITYGNSSDSIHDDMVMATAFSLYATKKGSYQVR